VCSGCDFLREQGDYFHCRAPTVPVDENEEVMRPVGVIPNTPQWCPFLRKGEYARKVRSIEMTTDGNELASPDELEFK
jgi:hypothetical protein